MTVNIGPLACMNDNAHRFQKGLRGPQEPRGCLRISTMYRGGPGHDSEKHG